MTNFVTNPGSGGSTFSSDTEGGVEVPGSKVWYGDAGSGQRVTATNPFPVSDPSIKSTSTDPDTPSLIDLLNPMNPNYVPQQAQIVGPDGQPFSKDPNSGAMMMLPSLRSYTFDFTTSGQTVTLPCDDMATFSFYAVGSVNVLPELFLGNTWSPSSLDGAWINNGNGQVQSVSSTLSLANMTGKIGLNGAKFIRLRATSSSSTPTRVTCQLSPFPVSSTSVVMSSGGGIFSCQAVTTPLTANTTSIAISSAATTNATSVRAAAANLFGMVASNTGASAAYLKLYNKATAPTVGTDVPILTVTIAAGATQPVDLGVMGYRFSTGIALAITGGAADSDTTAIAAAQVKIIGNYA